MTSSALSNALVEWDIQRTLKLEEAPIDVAVSHNGRWIHILTDQRDILIYSADGKLNDIIPVGKSVDGIKVGPRENIFFLTSRKDKMVQVLVLEFIQNIDVSGSPFKGPADAPVVIAVFSDFQRPYCARLLPLFEQVLEIYPAEVKFAFKNYPLRSHKFARKAAIAAQRQGKFWEFHDQLFNNAKQLSDEKIREIALELGVDLDQFEEHMRDPTIMTKIKKDIQDGVRGGVRGIPTIFINGSSSGTEASEDSKPLLKGNWKKSGKGLVSQSRERKKVEAYAMVETHTASEVLARREDER